MDGTTSSLPENNWRFDLLEDRSGPADTYAAEVILAATDRKCRLHGHLISVDLRRPVLKCLFENGFTLLEEEAGELLSQIFESHRQELRDSGGGIMISMDRKGWIEWLDYHYPGQGEEIEASLFAHIPQIP